ncbi:MAG TPA: shikimate dehydrogenase [Moorella mulderi]|nr:shikimate dehydrogenase [Moorella mulderi]
MYKFAFIIHPLDVQDVARKFPLARRLPPGWVEKALLFLPPVKVSHITDIRSPYSQTEGWFVACPLTTRQFLHLPEELVIDRIIRAGRLAERLGAHILGLGAMTAVVGDGGRTVAQNLSIAVTTGNSYTVATAIEATERAAQVMEIDLKQAKIAIIGATGSIGSVCARILAKTYPHLVLAARSRDKLERLAEQIKKESPAVPEFTTQVKEAVKEAPVIITVTSAEEPLIEPEDLLPGAVVCDVARPRDVSRLVAQKRDDVLVIDGGVVEVPGEVDFHFNFGYPKGLAYACMAETMILALEGRIENFSLGKELTVEQVEAIKKMAEKHGFRVAGFRSFELPLSSAQVEAIKARAKRKKAV